MSTVIGWTDCFSGRFPIATFTEDRKKALIERIRKRRYNFNFSDHQFLPYCCPVYEDRVTCELTKPQWDSVINEAYKDENFPPRLMPMDVITIKPINSVLYEKDKFIPKGGE
jgi:hypothetical protein